MKLRFGLFIIFLLTVSVMQGQELNCTLTINANKIQTTDKAIFQNLQTSLSELINNRSWTEAKFTATEKIDCSITVIINTMPSENQFNSEMQIVVRRPIYNTSYNSPIFQFQDNNFNFNYQDMQQIEFNENNITDNMTAVISFYVYVILGYDFDSFAPLGGEALFRKAEAISNAAQSLGEAGWKAFENDRNRHALITSLLNEKYKPIRELNYNYHRLGLDEMSKNADETRAKMTTYLKKLSDVQKIDPMNVVLQIFVETKVDEIVSLYSKASPSEKKTIFDLLSQVAPTLSDRYASLQK